MAKYLFKPYRTIFPQLFENEKERIISQVESILEIEHIGSTSIPKLGGKGIIDIAIAAKKQDMENASKALQQLGYEFRPSFSTEDRLYFMMELPDLEEGKRRYHVHLTYPDSPDWKGFIEFRDYLRIHPEAVQEYAEIKKKAAFECNQVGAHYRKLKEPIFDKVFSRVHNRSVEFLNESNFKEITDFLINNEDFSLFLLGNMEAHGPKLTSSPNSGNFKLVRSEGKVVAVFTLTRRGNLLIQSSLTEDWVMEKILCASEKESIVVKGLIGEWGFCQKFWHFLKQRKIIQKETFVSKEILYTVDLEKQPIFNNPNVRLLSSDDFTIWSLHRIEYLKEEGLPNDLSQEQMRELFLEKVKDRISWGYFENGNLVSMAELNAKARDLGQVGGVYTTPNHRKEGLAKAVMQGLMRDARGLHKIRKLIIFTGETNTAARKLYESFNFKHVGYFALMFGEKGLPLSN